MNIFRELLFLHGHFSPADYRAELETPRHRSSARTAARDPVLPPERSAGSRRDAALPELGCVTGGCG